MADAVQAYIQATLRGTPCWIELPPEAVPSECKWDKYRRPVVPLRKALYGQMREHSGSSTAMSRCVPLVLNPSAKNGLLCTFMKSSSLFWLCMSTTSTWQGSPRLDLTCTGCNESKGNGHRVTTVTYDMEQFLRSCVDRYLEVAGDVKLNKVVTPELHEETKNHVSRKPAREGPSVACNWCNNLVPTDGSATVPDQRGVTPELAMKEPVRGHLAPHAASVLMKLLYGARIARFDLLRQVNRLARNVHRWTDSDDRGLHHLMCYVHHTKHWRMVGWVGDPMDDVHLALYADADFAGCVDSLRSTSGGRLNTQGPNTRFPLSGSSKRQGCVSHSTPEAEIVAADVAMRSMGVPALKLVERILKKSPNFVFYDDNKAMIGVVQSGRNPTMRHLERSHGVSISWMHEMFTRDYMYLAYEVTDRMAADIYTKAFNDGRKWKHACLQIGLLDPSLLSDPDTLKALTPTCDPIKGTMQTASGTVDGVPTFPYTHIPIMPPDLWWSGLTSKEGLHEHEGHDPVVVKGPRLMRVKPPLAVMTPFGSKWLRSTWFLKNGSWLKVEDRVDPGLQCVRIDGWVERAVWQFHPVPVAVPARGRSPRPRPIHVGSGDVDMQSVLAAFVEELSNERIELKCVNDLALETLLRLKLLMRCLHINHERCALRPCACLASWYENSHSRHSLQC